MSNRYCDLKPLRDDNATANNRRRGDTIGSRGQQGEASSLKKEYERSEHSKSKQYTNQFADELNVTAMAELCQEASKDSERNEVMDSVKSKLTALGDKLIQAKKSLTECETRLSQLTSKRDKLDSKVNQMESEEQTMVREMKRIDSQLVDSN
jgi:chromosome segregation ATPase